MKKVLTPPTSKFPVRSQLTYVANSKKYDTKDEIVAVIGEDPIDYENVQHVTLSENSYGREACDYNDDRGATATMIEQDHGKTRYDGAIVEQSADDYVPHSKEIPQ